MGNLAFSIRSKCDECGKLGLDFICLQMPDGSYKVLCDDCVDKMTGKNRNV